MKYRGKYNIKENIYGRRGKQGNRLLNEAFQEVGAFNDDGTPRNIPDRWKVMIDKETFTVKSYIETKAYGSLASAEGAARARYGLSQQKYAAELVGGTSPDKLTAGDSDVSVNGGSLSIKSGAASTLKAPINKADIVTAKADPAQFAKDFLAAEGGKVFDPGTQQEYTAADYDFTKARISGYGGGGREAVYVPRAKKTGS